VAYLSNFFPNFTLIYLISSNFSCTSMLILLILRTWQISFPSMVEELFFSVSLNEQALKDLHLRTGETVKQEWPIFVDIKLSTFNFIREKYSNLLNFHAFSEQTGSSIERIVFMGESCTLQSKKPFKELLVNSDRIFLLPLQIWLSLMMLLFKALDKDGDCSTYFHQAIPCLAISKLKIANFDSLKFVNLSELQRLRAQ